MAGAVVLVVIVIFCFLRTIRATIIPLVTIPVSLVGAFAVMSVLGFSINTLTLLSMVLAIGLVVDDVIVVLENIHRHIEDGMKPMKAAVVGIGEISSAVVARAEEHTSELQSLMRISYAVFCLKHKSTNE